MQNPLAYASAKLKERIRRSKYTLGADVINFILAHTSFLDGSGQPPPVINFAGGGDFVKIGDVIVQRLVDHAQLKDGQAVLDVGCGIGRNATALARRFPNTQYRGFDIVTYGVTWCRKHFNHRKNFIFEHANIYNSFYNPRGSLSASQYAFDYSNQQFDVIFATSVFTHMPAAQIAHYLLEAKRCLKPGGICYFTCFILDDDSRQKIGAGKSQFSFKNKIEDGWTERALEPDVAVAFETAVFIRMVEDAGLKVLKFEPGNWRGDESLADFQDAFVLQ